MVSIDQLIDMLQAAAIEYRRSELSRQQAFIWDASEAQAKADNDFHAASAELSRARGALRAAFSALEERCTD